MGLLRKRVQKMELDSLSNQTLISLPRHLDITATLIHEFRKDPKELQLLMLTIPSNP